MTKEVSRRDFLKNSAAGALGIASIGILSGCATTPEAATEEVVTGPAATDQAAPEQAATEQPASETAQWDYETSLLVIGGGVAGLSAAIEAADQGFKDILVIEYLSYLGGDAFVCEGTISGWNSKMAKAQGINYSLEEVIKDSQARQNYELDPAIAKISIEKSGETIDWMIDTIGVEFEDSIIVKDGYGPLQVVHSVKGTGAALREPYEAAIAARPAIQILYETRASELIYENGAVIGVVATQGDKRTHIKAGATILSTGDYSSNAELVARVYPAGGKFRAGVMPNSTGDGLLMATEIGAGTQNLDEIQPYIREFDDPIAYKLFNFNFFVGKNGRRFMDEMRNRTTYVDENCVDVVKLFGDDDRNYFWGISNEATLASVLEDVKARTDVVSADTLEELATMIDVDPVGLAETVAHWNEICETGVDDEFGRKVAMAPMAEGPYYAIKITFFLSLCHGGILKNEKAEVQRFNGTSIKGLYGAGTVTAFSAGDGYTVNGCITFGRIAAQSAFTYVNG